MLRTMTIRSLPEAFAAIKEMRGNGYDWGEDYRAALSVVYSPFLGAALLGKQKPQHLQQDESRRPLRRQTRPASHHDGRQPGRRPYRRGPASPNAGKNATPWPSRR